MSASSLRSTDSGRPTGSSPWIRAMSSALRIASPYRDYKELGKSRAVKASVVTADYSGLFVDNQCLTTNEKKRIEVYVRGKDGSFGFKPVKSLASDGKQTMVAMSYYYDENGKRVDTSLDRKSVV